MVGEPECASPSGPFLAEARSPSVVAEPECGQLGPARKRPRGELACGEEELELDARVRRLAAEEFERRGGKHGAEAEAERVRRIVAEELERRGETPTLVGALVAGGDAPTVEAELRELKAKFDELDRRGEGPDAATGVQTAAELKEFKLKFNSAIEDLRRSFTAQTEVLRERNEHLTDQVEAARGEVRRLRAELEVSRSAAPAASPLPVQQITPAAASPVRAPRLVAPPAPGPCAPSQAAPPDSEEAWRAAQVITFAAGGSGARCETAVKSEPRDPAASGASHVITFAAGGGGARCDPAVKAEPRDPSPVVVAWEAPAAAGALPRAHAAPDGRFGIADCHLMTLARKDALLLGGQGAAAAWEVRDPNNFAVTFKVGGWGFGDSAPPPFFLGVAPAGVDLTEAWASAAAALPALPPPPQWAHWTLEVDPDSRPGSMRFPAAVQRGAFFAFHRVRLRSGAAYSRMPYTSYQVLAGGAQPSEHEWSHENSGNGPTSIRMHFTRRSGSCAVVDFVVYRQKDTVATWKVDLARLGLDPSAQYRPTIFFAESMSATVEEGPTR